MLIAHVFESYWFSSFDKSKCNKLLHDQITCTFGKLYVWETFWLLVFDHGPVRTVFVDALAMDIHIALDRTETVCLTTVLVTQYML